MSIIPNTLLHKNHPLDTSEATQNHSVGILHDQKMELFRSLLEALSQGKPDLITIKNLLKQGAPVTPTALEGIPVQYTALNYAIRAQHLSSEEHIELVKLFLEYGAPVDSSTFEDVVIRGHAPYLKSLLENRNVHSADSTSLRRVGRSVQTSTVTQPITPPKNEKQHSNLTTVTPQTKLYRRLSKAVRENSLTEVKSLIKQGAPLNDPTGISGFSPLHYAVKVAKKYVASDDNDAKNINREVIKQLLDAGASVDYKNQDGRSAIDVAINNKLYTLAKELKSKNLTLIDSTVPVISSDATLPLPAIHEPRANLPQDAQDRQAGLKEEQTLMSRGVLPTVPLQETLAPAPPTIWQAAQQALMDADYQRFFSLVPQLGSNITYTDDKGQNLFHYAAAYGNRVALSALTEQLRSYIRQGGSIHTTLGENLRDTQPTEECFYYYLSVPDKRGNTPLHLAAQKENDSTLRSLLTYGVNRTPPENQAGKTPQQMAAKNPRLIPLFVHARNAQDINLALSSNRINDALTLIEKCTMSSKGQSFEGWHTIGGHFYGQIGEALRQKRILSTPHYNPLSNQWHPEKKGLLGKFAIGTSLLHHAASYQWVPASIIDALVKKGILIDIPDQAGDTPLHFAIAAGNKTAIQSLISHGAKLDNKNHAGETPLDLARDPQYRDEILQMQLQTSATSGYRMG